MDRPAATHCLARLAAALAANHHPQRRVAAAPRAAHLILPELLSWSPVETVVGTTTAGGQHTLPSAEDVTRVASTGFHAGLGARFGGVGVGAGRRAGAAAVLVVAVLGAGQRCKRRGKGDGLQKGAEMR